MPDDIPISMTYLTPVARSDCHRLWYAVLATVLFVLVALVQGAVRPDYDAWHQSISALSLGPGGWVQDVAFAFLGIALLSTVPVWRRALADGVGARAYPVLIALTGISLIAAGWIPQDPAPGYDPELLGHTLPTITGLIHLGVAGVGALASSIALFVMAARFATLPDWLAWATYSRVTGVLTIVCVVVYAVWSTHASGFAGTFERLVIVLPGAWGYAVVSRLSSGTPFVVSHAPKRVDAATAA
ncbi:MAG: DUF998 domain-containing protein [Gemmatimonadaceae bacterium]|nr:DUF998 domain-containing protein [Gemmatimonadaceae bacterium]MCW5827317.1 DUF998 domain-containing protein [Gemmatimonadaceae bacterium]